MRVGETGVGLVPATVAEARLARLPFSILSKSHVILKQTYLRPRKVLEEEAEIFLNNFDSSVPLPFEMSVVRKHEQISRRKLWPRHTEDKL